MYVHVLLCTSHRTHTCTVVQVNPIFTPMLKHVATNTLPMTDVLILTLFLHSPPWTVCWYCYCACTHGNQHSQMLLTHSWSMTDLYIHMTDHTHVCVCVRIDKNNGMYVHTSGGSRNNKSQVNIVCACSLWESKTFRDHRVSIQSTTLGPRYRLYTALVRYTD